jgi:hypothetical protein
VGWLRYAAVRRGERQETAFSNAKHKNPPTMARLKVIWPRLLLLSPTSESQSANKLHLPAASYVQPAVSAHAKM